MREEFEGWRRSCGAFERLVRPSESPQPAEYHSSPQPQADGRLVDDPAAVSAWHSRLQKLVQALSADFGAALPLVQVRRGSRPGSPDPPATQRPPHTASTRPQVWLPKPRRDASSPRSSAFLSVESAPFVLNDPLAAPLRRKSTELTFGRGHGLPGRVWATGASEVIQDSTFVSAQHYSLRPSALSGGALTESIGVPIYTLSSIDPIGVLEVVVASNGASAACLEGRLRLVQGGAAAVIASICAALDSVGLSCSPPSGEEAPPAATASPASEDVVATLAAPPAGGDATAGSARNSADGGRRTPRHSASLSRISSCRTLQVPAVAGQQGMEPLA